MSEDKVLSEVTKALLAELKRNRRLGYVKVIVPILFVAFMFTIITPQIKAAKAESVNANKYRTITTVSSDPVTEGRSEVAILPVQGVIYGGPIPERGSSGSLLGGASTSNTVLEVKEMLQKIEGSSDVKTLVLYVNSPGGTVIASEEIYRMLLSWKKTRNIRIVAYFHSVAASGGYYIAQAADEIVADPNSITGSIGVILSGYNYRELARKIGVRDVTIKSGRHKDILSPMKEMDPAERAILQKFVDESYDAFLSVIAEGRKGRLTKAEIRPLADGRIYSGKQAKKVKLVDDALSFSDLVDRELKNLTGVRTREAVIYQKRAPSALDQLFASISKMGSVELPLAANLDQRPELMYMWPGR